MTTLGDSDSPDDSLLVIHDVPHQDAPSDDYDLESTSISNSYCGEWEKLFKCACFQERLKSFGMRGKLRSSRFRSICWKHYLEVLGSNYTQWIPETMHWRDKYDDLKQELITNPRRSENGSDLSLNNPLSQELESPWNQFFQDNELRVTIKQDVIRTFPDILFFQDKSVQAMMIDVLFCFCKHHTSLSYKQGMHELLAPLIFVLHCDHQAFLHACEIESVGEVIKTILDPDYVEHDAYAMFYQIMETMEPWYVSKEMSPTIKMNNVLLAQPFARNQDLHPSNVIVTKLTRIQDYLLKKHDPDLHGHLQMMDIPPQIYGIRWVRLLFGREFPMQDLLMLWDAIFADGIGFDLVDFVFVGMMLYIRDAMLTSDYPSCLYLLMKYPPVGDVHYFVDKALYLREPNQYPRPPNYTFQKPANFGREWDTNNSRSNRNRNRSNQNRIAEKAANVVSGLSTLTRRMNKSMRPQSFKSSISPQRMSKSTSEPMNLITDQSPEEELPGHTRKGSTASMSQLEGVYNGTPSHLRSARSTQSLPHTEMSSRRTSTSSRYGQEMEETSRMSWKCNGPERSGEQSLTHAIGRLNELERLCQMCAEKMGHHLDKLQYEVLRQQLSNEDDLLVSLAGLKQVRDVLKGTLKPSSVFDSEEISIHDNHYHDDQASSCQDSRRSSVVCSPPLQKPEPIEQIAYVTTQEVLPSSDSNVSLPDPVVLLEGSVTSGTTGSADSSPGSGGVPEYPSNPPSLETSSIEANHITGNAPQKAEIELRDYGVNSYTSSSNSSIPNGQDLGHVYSPINHSVDTGQVGGASTGPSNHSADAVQVGGVWTGPSNHSADTVQVGGAWTGPSNHSADTVQVGGAWTGPSNHSVDAVQVGRAWTGPSNHSVDAVQVGRAWTGPSNHSADTVQVGGVWTGSSNHAMALNTPQRLDGESVYNRVPYNGSTIKHGSQTPSSQPIVQGKRYHSAPPTPLDSVNSLPDDFGNMSPRQPYYTNQHTIQTHSALPRQRSGSNLYDPNQNTRKGPNLGFWGQRSTPVSREPSPINKLTDLFKGTFKF